MLPTAAATRAMDAGDAGFTHRLLAILLFVLSTLPVGSHLLARAAAREAGLTRAIDDAPIQDQN